ncbi:MAG: hypothetical protein U1F35_09930 [Steroidobacteraceae bacterium]
MNTASGTTVYTLLATALLAICCTLPAQTIAAVCNGASNCSENADFIVTVDDFRTSTAGRFKVVTATLRFQNTRNRPLILGYVNGSGVVTDDQGNRYMANGNGVRGIGVVGGNSVDTKFTLAPGERSDARMEFLWAPGRAIVGTQFDMDLTVREIQSVGASQYRLGKEHVLHFTRPDAAGGPPAATTQTPSPTPNAAAAPPMADPCSRLARCASGGPFIAQIVALTPQGGPRDRHHVLALNLRFRNHGDAPIVLAYKSNSSNATDNLGNGYIATRPGTHDTSFSGIGTMTNTQADASFVLRPGEARDASFKVIRFNSLGKPLGTSWVYDVVISQLEILPSQQVRVQRDYSLHFGGLTAGSATIGDALQRLDHLLNGK